MNSIKSIFKGTKYYSISAILLTMLVQTSITGRAMAQINNPSWSIISADPVSLEDAKIYYNQEAKSVSSASPKAAELSKLGSESTTALFSTSEVTAEITELARALQHDPKLIYDYVHNHVEYIPYFGSLRKAQPPPF